MVTEQTAFTHDDYEIKNREVVYSGVFRMAKYTIRHRLFSGGMSEDVLREVMERNPAVAVLPYDPRRDEVILIEQFRAGSLSNPSSPWLLELVAGSFNPGETPHEVARREAQEEAGCELLDLFPITEYFVSPGGCNEYLHLFCGNVDASNAGGIFGLAEESEDIRSFTLPREAAYILIQEGKIKTAPTIIALQWLELNREWLKQLWQKK